MVSDLSSAISHLATLCDVISEDPANGWEFDSWELSSEAVDALIDAYREILHPTLDISVVNGLKADGVDLDGLFAGPEESVDRITRSDMTELAGAASLVAHDQVNPEMMVTPNVPKGERTVSYPGLAIVAAVMNQDSSSDTLSRDECVIVCSVKHSVSDPADLRYKLARSIAREELNAVYVTSQLRILHGRLLERGIRCDRIFLVLSPRLEADHLRVIGIATMAPTFQGALKQQLALLPSAVRRFSRVRQIFISQLEYLHTRV